MSKPRNEPGRIIADLAAFDNAWYKPGAGLLKRSLWYWVNALLFNSWLLPSYRAKAWLLRRFGARIGSGVVIKPRVNIKYPWRLVTGDHVWVGEGVWIDNLADVNIGSDVCISQGAYVLTGNHDYKVPGFDLVTKAIVIEDAAWIAARAIICPGVRVASGSIITAGSVLTDDTQPAQVYAGNPAKAIRARFVET